MYSMYSRRNWDHIFLRDVNIRFKDSKGLKKKFQRFISYKTVYNIDQQMINGDVDKYINEFLNNIHKINIYHQSK